MDKRILNLKSQSSMEFISLLIILLFIFTMLIGILAVKITDINKKRTELSGTDITEKIQREINLAAYVSDGYNRDFTLPQKVSKKEYNISIVNKTGKYTLKVSTINNDFTRRTPYFEGEIQKGRNTIKKENGTIKIN